MIKIKILITLLILTISTQAQLDIVNKSLTDSSLNYIFINLENKIEIIGIERDSTVELTSNNPNNKIIKKSYNSYVCYFSKTNKEEDTLEIQVNSRGKIIYRKTYKIKELKEIESQIGNITKTEVKIEEILLLPKIKLNTGCYNSDWKIGGFTVNFVVSGDTIDYYKYIKKTRTSCDTIYTVNPETGEEEIKLVKMKESKKISFVNGEQFPSVLIDKIKTLKVGDKIIFKDIIVHNPYSKGRKLSPLILTIKR